MNKKVMIKVYGREQICASCVGAPGSKDTFEWLQAAIDRKYITDSVEYQYIDMDINQSTADDQAFISVMEEEEYLFPLIMINGEIAAEGIPQIKQIYRAIDEVGIDKRKI